MSRLEILQKQLIDICHIDATENEGFYQAEGLKYSILKREERYLSELMFQIQGEGKVINQSLFNRWRKVATKVVGYELHFRLRDKQITEFMTHEDLLELLHNPE